MHTVVPPLSYTASGNDHVTRKRWWDVACSLVRRIPPGPGESWRLIKSNFSDAFLRPSAGAYALDFSERQVFIDDDWATQDLPVSQAGYLYQEPYAWLDHVARLAGSVDHDYRDHWVQLGEPGTHTLYPDAVHSIDSQVRNANVLLWTRGLIGHVYGELRDWEALDTAGEEWGTDAKVAEMRLLFDRLCDATVGCGPHWLRQWTLQHNPLTWRAKLIEYKLHTTDTSGASWEPGDLIATLTGEGEAAMSWWGPLIENYAAAVDYFDTELTEAH